MHGGNTPTHRKAAQRVIAAQAVQTFGLPRDVDPADALLEEVHRTAGHVAWLGQVVGALDDQGLKQRDSWGRERLGVWVELYQSERKHLAAVAKAALDAGVEERRVRVAERVADQLGAALTAMLQDLGHDPQDPAVRLVVQRRMLEVVDRDEQAEAGSRGR